MLHDCAFTCTCAHSFTRTHIRTCTHTCKRRRTSMHAHTCNCMHTQNHKFYSRSHTHLSTQTHTHACTRTRARAHTQTNTCLQVQDVWRQPQIERPLYLLASTSYTCASGQVNKKLAFAPSRGLKSLTIRNSLYMLQLAVSSQQQFEDASLQHCRDNGKKQEAPKACAINAESTPFHRCVIFSAPNS